ncbi:MAG: DapH/DapD/GlmU-related protein [Rhodococcus sp. (in: high G+C Gram-positive bacteria)]
MTVSLLGNAYLHLRGRELPVDVPPSVVAGFAFRKGIEAARGLVLGARYAGASTLHFRGRRVRVTGGAFLRVGRGVCLGDDVRVEAFSRNGIELGDNVTVGRGATIAASGVIANPGTGVVIGDRTAVGMYNTVWGQGGVVIGRDCLLGPNVVIVSENHVYSDENTPIRLQGEERLPVTVGDDCWLGAGVVVVGGVTIGDGSVVGAGSVVTGDLPPGSVAVGSPARIVGSRREKGGETA